MSSTYSSSIMKKTTLFLSLALTLAGCTSQQQKYVDWLYESMPLPDELVYPESYWQENVAKTLEVRDRMKWQIPEREFRHFVLPLRVNNETLDDFRTVYADSLCDRVQGMSMEQAVLEINHWCHERATYQPSDARTSAPMATIARGLGRCGEESVVTVAALRAAGIPARQVYTPRWAHTDDNHAWVEAWVDGEWHFMGACEPEPVLDMGWFNASVSRALLLHTKVYGDYHGDEDVIQRNPIYTEINVIKGYVPSRRTTVTVLDTDGRPVEDARVEFKIYNYAEFYTVATYFTDSSGQTALDTGLGDMLIWGSKGERFGIAKADADQITLTLDKTVGEHAAMEFDIIPPLEKPLPSLASEEQISTNALRLAEEDMIRNARVAATVYPSVPAELAALISEKDLKDIREDVIEDASFRPYSGPQARFANSPRVEFEMLLPYREAVWNELGAVVETPSGLVDWIHANIVIDDSRNPQGLRIPPVAVLNSRRSDTHSADIFFVAACRALGWPARLEDGTGKTQVFTDGEWLYMPLAQGQETVARKGSISLVLPEKTEYYKHFTIAKVESGSPHLLDYDEDPQVAAENLCTDGASLDEGYYMLTSGTRLANGGVLSRVEFFNVLADSLNKVDVTVRTDESQLMVKGNIDVEMKFLRDDSQLEESLIGIAGRNWFVVVAYGDKTEPNTHAKRQLESIREDIQAWGGKVIETHDTRMLEMIASGCDASTLQTPYVIVADSFGRVVYLSQGYNTSLGSNLSKVLKAL